MKRAYNWIIKYAEHPKAEWIMATIAFAESSFFPLPPDLLLLPMAIAQPKKVWRYALICTVSSVIGGILGYYIGYAFYETIGDKIIRYLGLQEGFNDFKSACVNNAFLLIAGKGLTPIPYKIVTIVSGMLKVDMTVFLAGSIIARATRFFMWAAIVHYMGDKARDYIEKNMGLFLASTLGAIILGFVVVKYFGTIKMYISTLIG